MAFVIRMEGLPFDGVDDKHLYTQFVGLKNLLASVGKTMGSRLAIWGVLQRQKINFDRDYTFSNDFCQHFTEKYLNRFQTGDYFENVFHLAVVLKVSDIDGGIKEANELAAMMMRSLEPYEPTMLTAYQNSEGILFSEVYEFYGSLVNGCREQIPLSATDAFQTIPGADLHFGTDICEIRPQVGARKFAQMYDLKDFGISKPKILNGVLTLPFEFTLVQSLIYVNPYDMQSTIRKQLNNLESAGDMARDQAEEMREGQGSLVSGELMFGDYHAVLVVYGKTAQEVAYNGPKAHQHSSMPVVTGLPKLDYQHPRPSLVKSQGVKSGPAPFRRPLQISPRHLVCTITHTVRNGVTP